jgi:4-hydroxy-tetrahydrodipicolinate synthase
MTRPIQGVLPIAHTPFLDDDVIDFQSLKRQIDWAFSVGADGVGTGMVSELLRLTFDERQRLTETLGGLIGDRGIFVAGVGAESTKHAIQYARIAEAAGAAADKCFFRMARWMPVAAC